MLGTSWKSQEYPQTLASHTPLGPERLISVPQNARILKKLLLNTNAKKAQLLKLEMKTKLKNKSTLEVQWKQDS